jgi:hypothetical protein
MRSALRPLLLGVCLVAVPASASSIFPSVLREESGSARTPTCVVCHETNSGGFGTAIKPFNQALEDRGLRGAAQTGSLRTAFQELGEDGVDSDADGTSDFDEIFFFRDPNIALSATVDDCLSPGACETTGTDGGTDPDGGTGAIPPGELPNPLYGVGCASAGGLQAMGGLALLTLFGVRRLRRRA